VGYSPKSPHNLFSALKVKNRLRFIIDGDETYVIDKNTNKLIQTAKCDGRFWRMNFEIPSVDIHPKEREAYLMREERKIGGRNSIKCHKSFLNQPEIWENSCFTNNNAILEVNGEESDFNLPIENLGGRYEMKISDLESINKNRTRALQVSEGILWHLRLNHASQSYLELAKNLIPDLKGVKITDEIKNCLECKLAKAKRKPFNQERTRATRPFQIVESDMMGPITPASIKSRAKYAVTFTDNYSRFAMGYELYDKTQMHRVFERYLMDMREFMNNEEIRIESLVNVRHGRMS
jgi:hypothetical protein